MRKIQIEEVQPLLLSMFKAFDAFALDNGLSYYAAGGSLLGAIRHHGFIPWDDDIDLFIKRKTAEELISIIKQNPYLDSAKRYKILLPATYPNVYPIFKLIDTKTVVYEKNISKKYACGLWIDIFIMNNWPDDYKQSERLFAKQKRIKKWLQLSIFGNLKAPKYKVIAPLAMIVKSILLLFGKNFEYWSKKLYHLGLDYETNHIGNLAWASTIKDRYSSKLYITSKRVSFEDTTISIPLEYDKILSQFYGDYMQLPPENKRIRHNFEAYYLD